MNFGEQINYLLSKMPDDRQTLLYSATMPKQLANFADARLNDPVLVRMDLDHKIPPTLKVIVFFVRTLSVDV